MKDSIRRRITSACTNCKDKKTKCEVERPCKNCLNHGWECISKAPAKRGPRKDQFRKKNSAKPAKPVKSIKKAKKPAARTKKTDKVAEVTSDGSSPSSLHTSPSSSLLSYYQDDPTLNLGHPTCLQEKNSFLSTESDNIEQGCRTPEDEDEDEIFSNFINYEGNEQKTSDG